jgi:glycosyltransferase involved in cell wall biosynthesis
VHCPKLTELPPPPAGKTGWPWTEESESLLERKGETRSWPRISVVTPSFNQGEFLEETIRSILLQGYPDLEYLVLDGGSTDNSVEIIKKYSSWISYWVSESDAGQSDAINRGLKRASGEFATWINSDDLLCQNALVTHASEIGFESNTVYVAFCIYIDQHRRYLSRHRGRVYCLEDLVSINSVWRSKQDRGNIDQPAVLFPRELALFVGGVNRDNHSTMDYELWGEFFYAGAKFRYTDVPFGMFRQHSEQKTYNTLKITESLLDTAARLVRRGDCFSEKRRAEILAELEVYEKNYLKDYWRGSGRLAQMGLSPAIVMPLRKLRSALRTLVS